MGIYDQLLAKSLEGGDSKSLGTFAYYGEEFEKSHVKAHFRRDKTGKLLFIKDYDDARHKSEVEHTIEQGEKFKINNPKSKHHGKEFTVRAYNEHNDKSGKKEHVSGLVDGVRSDLKPEHLEHIDGTPKKDKKSHEMSQEEFISDTEKRTGVKRGQGSKLGLDVHDTSYSDQWKIAHKESVKLAIKNGKIKSHPDYPELSTKPSVKDNMDLAKLGSSNRLDAIRKKYPDLTASEQLKLSRRIGEAATGTVGSGDHKGNPVMPQKDDTQPKTVAKPEKYYTGDWVSYDTGGSKIEVELGKQHADGSYWAEPIRGGNGRYIKPESIVTLNKKGMWRDRAERAKKAEDEKTAKADAKAAADAATPTPVKKEVKGEFMIKKNTGFEKVTGKTINIEGFDKIDFFIHKTDGEWVISEKTTGLKGATGKTQAAAKAQFLERLKHYSSQEDFMDKIKSFDKVPPVKDLPTISGGFDRGPDPVKKPAPKKVEPDTPSANPTHEDMVMKANKTYHDFDMGNNKGQHDRLRQFITQHKLEGMTKAEMRDALTHVHSKAGTHLPYNYQHEFTQPQIKQMLDNIYGEKDTNTPRQFVPKVTIKRTVIGHSPGRPGKNFVLHGSKDEDMANGSWVEKRFPSEDKAREYAKKNAFHVKGDPVPADIPVKAASAIKKAPPTKDPAPAKKDIPPSTGKKPKQSHLDRLKQIGTAFKDGVHVKITSHSSGSGYAVETTVNGDRRLHTEAPLKDLAAAQEFAAKQLDNPRPTNMAKTANDSGSGAIPKSPGKVGADALKQDPAGKAPSFDKALDGFVSGIQNMANEYHDKHLKNVPPGKFSYTTGKKYIKVIDHSMGGKGQKSVWGFINKENGDILKAANWNTPAKHARGNIMTDKNFGLHKVTHRGPAYLK